MRKLLILISTISLLLISSCAPMVFQPGYCEAKFREQKDIDNQIPEYFSFSGSALISGLPAILKGKFSKDGDTINISSPFGKNLLSIERKDGNICVKAQGFQSCNGEEILSMVSLYMPQAESLTDINLLKGLVLKKFYLNDKDKFECDAKQLKVLRKDYTLVYQDKNLSQIIYKNYTVEYNLNNQIEIKDGNNTLVKINISNITFNNDK